MTNIWITAVDLILSVQGFTKDIFGVYKGPSLRPFLSSVITTSLNVTGSCEEEKTDIDRYQVIQNVFYVRLSYLFKI